MNQRWDAEIAAVRADWPPNMVTLLRYWWSLAGGDAPARELFEPAVVKSLLPSMTIAEIEPAPLRVRYRLGGSLVEARLGSRLTGTYLDSYAVGKNQASLTYLQDCYGYAYQRGRAIIGTYDWTGPDGQARLTWFGLYPVTLAGDITQCLGIGDYSVPSYDDIRTDRPFRRSRKIRRSWCHRRRRARTSTWACRSAMAASAAMRSGACGASPAS